MIKKLLLLNPALRLACFVQKVVTGKIQDDTDVLTKLNYELFNL